MESNVGIKTVNNFVQKPILKIWCILSMIMSVLIFSTYIYSESVKNVDIKAILFVVAMALLLIDTVLAIKQCILGLRLAKVNTEEYKTIFKQLHKLSDLRQKFLISCGILYGVFLLVCGKFIDKLVMIIILIIVVCMLSILENMFNNISEVIVTGKQSFKFSLTPMKVYSILLICNAVKSIIKYVNPITIKLYIKVLGAFHFIMLGVCLIVLAYSIIGLLFVNEIEKSIKYTVQG